jgi:polyhydroxybutyrate depolymerase
MAWRDRPRRLLLAAAPLALAVVVLAGHAIAGAATAADEQRSITSQGQVWQYLFHRPPSVAATTPAPLVVVLHGSPDTPEAMAARTHFDSTADQNGFLVAYPRLPLTPGGDATGASKIQVVADIIDQLIASDHVQPNRVFVTGFSGGAVQAYRMGCVYADKVAAVAPVSGSMTRDCAPSRPVSVYAIHGTSDGTFPFNGGQYTEPVQTTVNRWLASDKCPSTPAASTVGPVQRQIWQPCADGTSVELDAIVKGVHAWPGDPRYPHGTPDGDFDAAPAIWQFFAAHGRAAPKHVVVAAVGRVRVVHRGTSRSITTVVRGAAATAVRVSLLRPSGRIAASLTRKLTRDGTTTVVLRVPRSVKAGHYRVRVKLGALTQTRPVTLPAP